MSKFGHKDVGILPIVKHAKDTYLMWFEYFLKIPKIHRYTLGLKIDNILIDIIENISSAGFAKLLEKQNFIDIAIRKNDTLKVLVMILWETKSIDDNKYLLISKEIDDMGKMLGGWVMYLQKQNSPGKS